MPLPDEPTTTITVVLSGILLVCPSKDLSRCEVGVVRGVDNHELKIIISKNGVDEPVKSLDDSSVASRLWLKVENTTKKGIELNTPGNFSRSDNDEPSDFRWMIDFEGDEFYGKKLEIDYKELDPIIRFDGGFFYTKDISTQTVRLTGAKDEVLGRVALYPAIDIVLDKPDSKAILMNGEEEFYTFTRAEGTGYTIDIARHCVRVADTKNTAEPPSDFLHHYKVIGKNLKENEKIDLDIHEGPVPVPPADSEEEPDAGEEPASDGEFDEVTPDARCIVGRLSLTNDLGWSTSEPT